jgi:hypothetical protein
MNAVFATTRIDVIMATDMTACWWSISGNDTKLMHKATAANRNATPQIRRQPSDVVKTPRGVRG